VFWNCRPFLEAKEEVCEMVVPNNVLSTRIAVKGFVASNFILKIAYTPR